jgi:hypothetical protein
MMGENDKRINEEILQDLREPEERAPEYLEGGDQATFLKMKGIMKDLSKDKDIFAQIKRKKDIKDFDISLSRDFNTNDFLLWYVLMDMTLPNKKLVLDTRNHEIENFIKSLK